MKANKKFNRGGILFTFEDEDGEIFSKFRMNPTDVNLVKRAEEVSQYFEKRKDDLEKELSTGDIVALNDEFEQKINYLLGYDARDDIFGEITATTISQDGEVFGLVLMDFIIEKLKPELEKRSAKMQQAMAKYTEKYN